MEILFIEKKRITLITGGKELQKRIKQLFANNRFNVFLI